MSILSLVVIAGLYFLAALDFLAHGHYPKAALTLVWGAGNLALVWDTFWRV